MNDLTNQPANFEAASGGGLYEAGLRSLVKSLQLAFVVLVVLIVGMLVWFFSVRGYFAVQAQESIIVLRFGKYLKTFDSGWHWFMPYPVHQFIPVKTAPQSLRVEYVTGGTPRFTPDGKIIPQPMLPGRDNYLLTSDANIVHTAWNVTYSVSEPYQYYITCLAPDNPLENDTIYTLNGVNGGRGPQTLLKALLSSAVLRVTASLPIDDLLYANQTAYREEVQRVYSALVNEMNIGVTINSLTLDRVGPPAQTLDAFRQATNANNTKSQLINEAEQYRVTMENNVMAQQAKILADAETYRKQIVAEVKAESVAFDSIYAEYVKSPETVLSTLYNNTLSTVLGQVDDQFVLGSEGGQKELRLKLNPNTAKKQNNPMSEGQ